VTRLGLATETSTIRNHVIDGAALAFVGLAGAVWGLGLARVLSESIPESPTFQLGPTLFLTGVVAVLFCGVAWWFGRSACDGPDDGLTISIAFVPFILVLIYVFWPGVAPLVGWTLLGASLALTTLLVFKRARTFPYSLIVASLLACVTFAIYLRTLGPTVGRADTFEFQVVAPTLGVAHPTGYPLYILIGKIFTLLPIGSVAWRVNLTSAVFAVLASLLVYLFIQRLTKRPMVAFVAALALAFSRVYWSQAVVAEVYALHSMFVIAILFILLVALGDPDKAPQAEAREQQLTLDLAVRPDLRLVLRPSHLSYFLALLLGLSFANHLTTLFLVPAVLLALYFVRPRLTWRQWLVAFGFLVLGIALYGYIFIRWPMLHDGAWMSPGAFWQYITGQQFGGALQLNAWRTDPTRYEIIGRLLYEPFGWTGLVLCAAGLVWLIAKNWRAAMITVVTFLAFVAYGLSYYVPDVSVFLLPAYLVMAIWLGAGMAAVLAASGRLVERIPRPGGETSVNRLRALVFTLLVSMFALLPAGLLWSNLPEVDQSGQWADHLWGDRVMQLPLAPDSTVLADSVHIAPLYYLQRIEGRRPDMDLLVLADEATYRAELESRLAGGQTVYLARYLPGLEGQYHLRSLGPLTEVGAEPLRQLPPLDRELGVLFSPSEAGATSPAKTEVELVGFSGPVPGPSGGTGLTLYWRALAPAAGNYHVRLRLVDEDGQVWWQEQGHHAANGYYPTVAWDPGEVVPDYHEIPPLDLDPIASPDHFTLQVGLFHPFSDLGLAADNGEFWYSLPDLQLPAEFVESAPEEAVPVHFSVPLPRAEQGNELLAELKLVGVDLADVVTAGSLTPLRLRFAEESAAAVREQFDNNRTQFHMRLNWVDENGHTLEAPIEETWDWSRLSVRAPDASGIYDLWLGMVDGQGQTLPARCGWLAGPAEGCRLGTLRVNEAIDVALANFDDKMLLVDYQFVQPEPSEGSVPRLSPGQRMDVILHWQGLQTIEEDYTVSVQLIGPDGRLYGQIDAWPVQGTFPTSQWSSGQRISDPYQIAIADDAPSGRYQVGVVVYLLETGSRLPLLDGSRQIIGDIAYLGEVEVVGE
jgi:hypothetical protein